ncbi:mannose-1-phosphate guanylyltransferase, partial [Bacteroidota bacterium]
SRFWPLSRTKKPKQFLDILGTGKTLLQQTYSRFKTLCLPENIFIVTNSIYRDLVIEQLPEINGEHVLLEPFRRNTAPCIAYASHRINRINPDANIIVAPSDHLILNENEFTAVIEEGLEFVTANNALLTLGIKPGRPETGYGYIQVNGKKIEFPNKRLKSVKTFTEKPDLELAKVFYSSGDFFWNSGIFIWSLRSIMESFNKYLPEVNNLFASEKGVYGTQKEKEFINRIYADCPNISIDYGIMEKASNVFVICADFGWSDLGTWGSLYEHLEKDAKGNSIVGDNVLLYDSEDCLINMPENKLVVMQGMKGYIVIESDGLLLICKKEEEQKIKQFVVDIQIQKGETFI